MKMLYADLSPKDRFLKILDLHVLPELETYGFKLRKTGPSLLRKESGFEWIVEFQGSSWNYKNEVCCYRPYYTVANSDYRKYIKTNNLNEWEREIVASTYGIQHWKDAFFLTDGSPAHFLEDVDFAQYDNEQLSKDIVENVLTTGMSYFKSMSDFDEVKRFYITHRQRKHATRLVDLCYVLNRPDELQSVFDWYYTDNEGCADELEAEMKLRLKRL